MPKAFKQTLLKLKEGYLNSDSWLFSCNVRKIQSTNKERKLCIPVFIYVIFIYVY